MQDTTRKKPELNLVGEDGNAFFILGKAQKKAKECKWSKDQIECFMAEAMSGDYNNLLAVCMKYFNVT